MNQMRGGFSAEIGVLRSELLNFASLIELELDFGEEDVEFADRKDLKAIVSEIPGTTRDTIEDTIVIDSIGYRFIDTAGLRETTDVIEVLGIKKTHEKIDQASVILLIDEISDSAESINKRAKAIREMIRESEKRLFILINKIDQASPNRQTEIAEKIILEEKDFLLFISAKENPGLDNLRLKLSEVNIKERLSSDDVIITNIRHYEALLRVSESLERVISGLNENIPEDLIAIDIRQAIHYLGEITGEITSDEILGNIFRNFCIGK